MALIRKKSDTDGECFALTALGGQKDCSILHRKHKYCGTYRCPFYKPQGCTDWIRQEHEIVLLTPEEVQMEIGIYEKRHK